MNLDNYSFNAVNTILLQRNLKLVIDPAEGPSSDQTIMVLTIAKNIEDLGFIFSQELFESLIHQPAHFLIDFYPWLISVLKEMVGAHVEHQPFYKNFPQQMGALSELDLLMNALIHYWTDGRWEPEYVKVSRLPLRESKPQTAVIQLAQMADFHQIFSQMMRSKGSLSPGDQDLLRWYLKNSNPDHLAAQIPESIPSKEILGLVAAQLMECHPDRSDLIAGCFKTATDVLRFATALSGGDLSLSATTRYQSLCRFERRFILSLLDQCQYLEEDMGRYPEQWKRLGERLHPGDYSKIFPNVYHVFKKIRSGEKLASFHSAVEQALQQKDLERALSLLSQRPGELARRLDFLARTFPGQENKITACFQAVVEEISSRVLLQLMTHFKHRNADSASRSFFPKGDIAKVQVIENTLPDLPEPFCQEIVSIGEHALIHRFSEKEPLGIVYIDPILKDIMVPMTQRSSSRALKTFARGSKFDLGENCRALRAFIHWRNVVVSAAQTIHSDLYDASDQRTSFVESGELAPIQDWRAVLQGAADRQAPAHHDPSPAGNSFRQIRTDIDLSLGLYDENWEYIEHISYTNLSSDQFEGLYHSGDIVDAPEGASEFIDLDIGKMQQDRVRFAVFNVYSYTRQGFNEIPECFFGWMEREAINTGEIFEPKTVVNKIDLASPTTICLPVVFDLKLKQAVWLDVALRSHPRWVNNLEANRNNVVLISRSLMEMHKPNCYDLFKLHVRARGVLVDDPTEADITFGISADADVTPFQVERILAEFF